MKWSEGIIPSHRAELWARMRHSSDPFEREELKNTVFSDIFSPRNHRSSPTLQRHEMESQMQNNAEKMEQPRRKKNSRPVSQSCSEMGSGGGKNGVGRSRLR